MHFVSGRDAGWGVIFPPRLLVTKVLDAVARFRLFPAIPIPSISLGVVGHLIVAVCLQVGRSKETRRQPLASFTPYYDYSKPIFGSS